MKEAAGRRENKTQMGMSSILLELQSHVTAEERELQRSDNREN